MAVKTFNGKIKRVFFKKLDAADQYGKLSIFFRGRQGSFVLNKAVY